VLLPAAIGIFLAFTPQSLDSLSASPGTLSHSILVQQIESNLKILKADSSSVRKRRFVEDSSLEISATIPRGLPWPWISSFFQSAELRKHITAVFLSNETLALHYRTNSGSEKVVLKLQKNQQFFPQTARIAIVIHDFTFSTEAHAVDILARALPYTLAFFPDESALKFTAALASEYNKEFLIKLGLEGNHNRRNPSVIKLHETQDQIKKKLKNALAPFEHAAGVINDGGSKLCSDSRVMQSVFSYLAARDLLFVADPPCYQTDWKSIAAPSEVAYIQIQDDYRTLPEEADIDSVLAAFAEQNRNFGQSIVLIPQKSMLLSRLTADFLSKNGIEVVSLQTLSSTPHPLATARR